jgi:ergothioneine biosynthesis protein EgtB
MSERWNMADPAAAYRTVRARTEALAAPLGPEDQVVQSMPDASPTKWHRAHTTWFFDEFVLRRHGVTTGSDDSFRYLFNSYYEAVGDRQPRARRGLITRPDVEAITAYRRRVDAALVELIGRVDEPLIELGLHHEEQHQELLLMDAKHLLAQNPTDPVYANDAPHTAAPDRLPTDDWIEHPGGQVDVGATDTGFAYDNERPRHATLVRPFALATRLVTAGDWLAFMADGGYERAELWLSDGWALARAEGWEAPLYWGRADGSINPTVDADRDAWTVFTLAGRVPVDPAAPVVHVSYHEADAYARWAGHRLPTEFEWECIAAERWDDPTLQFDGQVWQWTASAYLPYPGFVPAAGAVGEYNGKFMVNQHVLRGGCCATAPGHSRPTYRNFFPPASRWMFSGLRLARDV